MTLQSQMIRLQTQQSHCKNYNTTIANGGIGANTTIRCICEHNNENVKSQIVQSASGNLGHGTDDLKKQVTDQFGFNRQHAMYPNTTNGYAAIAQTVVRNCPELKTLDFDCKDSDEFAQFAVAFPKSWNREQLPFKYFLHLQTLQTQEMLFGHLLELHSQITEVYNTAFG